MYFKSLALALVYSISVSAAFAQSATERNRENLRELKEHIQKETKETPTRDRSATEAGTTSSSSANTSRLDDYTKRPRVGP